MLLGYFLRGTEQTRTGSSIGVEIETDFVTVNGVPPSTMVTNLILSATYGRPAGCVQKLELGRQKIELAIGPAPSFSLLEESIQESLRWLYTVADKYGAYPLHAPEITWEGPLVYVQEERDRLWMQMDGEKALEHLCRCSSVQFTVAVNPAEAATVLNLLWKAGLHTVDYQPNNRRWLSYIEDSQAGYRPDRYGGPAGFDSLAEYVYELERHQVRMHQGQPVQLSVDQVESLDVELFLRSIWWHYRLRRYGDTLTVEIRPFARRSDEAISHLWKRIANVLGL